MFNPGSRRTGKELNPEAHTERPSTDALIKLELHTKKKCNLSITLPFEKNKPYFLGWEGCRKEMVADLLRRTTNSKRWFFKAHILVGRRGTQLGSLGYLPVEIRQNIWELVLIPPDYQGSTERPGIEVGRGRNSSFNFHDYSYGYSMYHTAGHRYSGGNHPLRSIYNLRTAIGYSHTEIDHVYLSTREFSFAHPECLVRYLALVGRQVTSLRYLTIWIFSATEGEDERLLEALTYLPPNLTSVTFKPSKVTKKGNKTIERQIWMLDILDKRIVRASPNADTRLWKETEFFEDATPALKARIEAVLLDVER